jgi:glucose uptake protein GlcU
MLYVFLCDVLIGKCVSISLSQNIIILEVLTVIDILQRQKWQVYQFRVVFGAEQKNIITSLFLPCMS